MRVLIVQPDINRTQKPVDLFPCIGSNLLSTILNKKGHITSVFDPLMEALKFPDNKTTIDKIIAEKVIKEEIEVLGISIVLQTRWKAIEIAKVVKVKSPKTKIILGGPGASLLASQFLTSYPELFDFVVIGEAEDTLPELLNAIEGSKNFDVVKGTAFAKSGDPKDIVFTHEREPIKNLDDIPFPNYSSYFDNLPRRILKTACILTYRGCPYDCTFCGNTAMKRNLRFRTPSNVVEEIMQLNRNFKVENFRINDDTFGLDRERTTVILHQLVESRLKLNLYAHSRIDCVDKDFLSLFRKAGGRELYYGIESGSPRIRKLMSKNISNDQILKICSVTKELGIKLGLYLMFGYPTETIADIKETYELVKRIDPDDVACAVTKIQPGTRLFKLALDQGIITDDVWMSDNREYFTFLTKEQEDFIEGCEILFYDNFVKKAIRTNFEKNSDLINISLNPEKRAFLKEKAVQTLGIKIKT